MKRSLCFTCLRFHPEMRCVSQAEFDAGERVCAQPKCAHRGEPLEPAFFCERCNAMVRWGAHEHPSI